METISYIFECGAWGKAVVGACLPQFTVHIHILAHASSQLELIWVIFSFRFHCQLPPINPPSKTQVIVAEFCVDTFTRFRVNGVGRRRGQIQTFKPKFQVYANKGNMTTFYNRSYYIHSQHVKYSHELLQLNKLSYFHFTEKYSLILTLLLSSNLFLYPLTKHCRFSPRFIDSQENLTFSENYCYSCYFIIILHYFSLFSFYVYITKSRKYVPHLYIHKLSTNSKIIYYWKIRWGLKKICWGLINITVPRVRITFYFLPCFWY